MSIITSKDLPSVREKHRTEKVIFCSGTFDLFHTGHVFFLEDCKRLGDILVVSVGRDELVKKIKGPKRPIFSETARIKIVSALNPVDYCFLEDHREEHPNAHAIDILRALQPDVWVVNEDAFHLSYRHEMAKQANTEFIVLPRTCPPEFENISTSQLIDKIKNIE